MTLARPDTSRRIVLSATLTAVAMVAQQVGGTATRDALFLSHHPASQLPLVMIAAAALSLVAVWATSAAYPQVGPARVVPFAFATNALLYFLEYVLVPGAPGVTSVVVYLHASVVGAVVISGFWSVVNERFDPYTAKRVIGGIAAGAALGGVLGGLVAERVATWFDVRTMLVVLGTLNVVCCLAILQVGAPRRTPSAAEPMSGLAALRETPYLRKLARLVGGVALTAAVLNYVFKAEAAAAFQTGEALMSFFAVFYASTSILTFLLQSVASRRVLKQLGLGATIAILPISVIALGALGAAFTRLWTVIALRATESVLVNSVFRSGYELLYTPVALNLKRPAKTIIDVAFDRVGDAVGSGLVLSVLFLAPPAAHSWLIGAATVSAAFVAWTAFQLHRGYVEQLADSLRSGALQLDEQDVVDATTQRTYAMTAVAIDRDELLRKIEAFRSTPGDGSPGGPSAGAVSAPAAPSDADRQRNRVTDRVAALVSGDPTRAIQALREPLDPQLVGHVIPLLAHDGTARQAAEALRRIGPVVVGQLADALLDHGQALEIRRRIPSVLAVSGSQRAAEGLMAGLSDPRFEVRYRCSAALVGLVERVAELNLPETALYAAVRRELELDERVWKSHEVLSLEADQESTLVDAVIRKRMHRSLEHVFNMLGVLLDREVLKLSLHALFSDDDRLRGTALEYLENVLPHGVRERLWPYIGGGQKSTRPERSHDQIVEELFTSTDSLRIDLAQLRKQVTR